MPVLQIWGDLYPPLPVAVPEDQLDTNNKPQPDLLRNKLLLDMLFSKETTPSEQETKEIDDLLTKTFPDVPSHTGQYLLKRNHLKTWDLQKKYMTLSEHQACLALSTRIIN
jgi:hypothetical protein